MYFFLLLFPFLCWSLPFCLFSPPKNWQAAQNKELSEHVQIGFIGNGSTDFHPSINLATEEVDCGMKEYLKAVKEIHRSQPGTKWRDLGKIEMLAGTGRLTEIISPSPWGEVYMLQALYIQDGMAYILTGALLKPDLLSFKNELLSSFRSLQLVPTLSTPIQDPEMKSAVEALFSSLGTFSSAEKKSQEQEEQWKAVQQLILTKGEAMGQYWQFLALKEGRAKIFTPL